MSGVDIDSVADELLAAYRTGKTLPPLTTTYPGLTVDQAYAIQQRQAGTRTSAGAGIVGFKIGLTSAAMQQQLGVDQPDYGHLFSDMLHGVDTPIPTSAFLQPRAEPEIALVLAQPLRGPGLSVADVLSVTAYALPAIEIIDSRITDWRIGLGWRPPSGSGGQLRPPCRGPGHSPRRAGRPPAPHDRPAGSAAGR